MEDNVVLLSDALDEGGQQNLQDDDSGKVRLSVIYFHTGVG